jgi:hypothetical protein
MRRAYQVTESNELPTIEDDSSSQDGVATGYRPHRPGHLNPKAFEAFRQQLHNAAVSEEVSQISPAA